MLTSFVLFAAVAALNRAPSDHVTLEGTAVIFTRSKTAVGIVVDSNGDGLADDLFWFYSETPPNLHVTCNTAVVVYAGDNLIVTDTSSGNVYVFGTTSPRVPGNAMHPFGSSTAFLGYGLSHKMGPALAQVRVASVSTGIRRFATEGVVKVEDCTDNPLDCILDPDSGDSGSGGGSCNAGVVQCSCTQPSGCACSITCGSGYHACCQCSGYCPTCSCIK